MRVGDCSVRVGLGRGGRITRRKKVGFRRGQGKVREAGVKEREDRVREGRVRGVRVGEISG